MSHPTAPATTLSRIAVAMLDVVDQDAAIAFYVDKLGFELCVDARYGEQDELRWVEVAPPGSDARLALTPPVGDAEPGGSVVGVESSDVPAEYARLRALGGVALGPYPQRVPGAPLLFMVHDPDGNHVAVVEEAPSR